MPYPQTPDKWRDQSLSGPDDFIGWAVRSGFDPGPAPTAVVFTYDPMLTAHLRSQPERFSDAPNLAGNGTSFATGPDHARVWVSCTGVGPSPCTMELENLHYLGCRQFLSIGIAGGINPSLSAGDLVLLTSALRDDGLSQHYLPDARYATPSESLTKRLRDALTGHGETLVEGATWTQPTPNRTTAREFETYRDEGILTCEMEAAALFAIGEALDVDVASAVVVSDLVGPEKTEVQYLTALPVLLRLLDHVLEMLVAS
jgi:nucleoside phosphorylase